MMNCMICMFYHVLTFVINMHQSIILHKEHQVKESFGHIHLSAWVHLWGLHSDL